MRNHASTSVTVIKPAFGGAGLFANLLTFVTLALFILMSMNEAGRKILVQIWHIKDIHWALPMVGILAVVTVAALPTTLLYFVFVTALKVLRAVQQFLANFGGPIVSVIGSQLGGTFFMLGAFHIVAAVGLSSLGYNHPIFAVPPAPAIYVYVLWGLIMFLMIGRANRLEVKAKPYVEAGQHAEAEAIRRSLAPSGATTILFLLGIALVYRFWEIFSLAL